MHGEITIDREIDESNRFVQAARAAASRPYDEQVDAMVRLGLFTIEEGERAKRNHSAKAAPKRGRRPGALL